MSLHIYRSAHVYTQEHTGSYQKAYTYISSVSLCSIEFQISKHMHVLTHIQVSRTLYEETLLLPVTKYLPSKFVPMALKFIFPSTGMLLHIYRSAKVYTQKHTVSFLKNNNLIKFRNVALKFIFPSTGMCLHINKSAQVCTANQFF